MIEDKPWLTCREVSVLLGCSQRHVLNLIKKKNISVNRDESGKYFIDKSEFYRVYPDVMNQEKPGTTTKTIEDSTMKLLEEKIKHLEAMIDEKNKHSEFLKEQLSNFTDEKSKLLDAINGHTRLLEYKESNAKPNHSVKTDCDKKSFRWSKLFTRSND